MTTRAQAVRVKPPRRIPWKRVGRRLAVLLIALWMTGGLLTLGTLLLLDRNLGPFTFLWALVLFAGAFFMLHAAATAPFSDGPGRGGTFDHRDPPGGQYADWGDGDVGGA